MYAVQILEKLSKSYRCIHFISRATGAELMEKIETVYRCIGYQFTEKLRDKADREIFLLIALGHKLRHRLDNEFSIIIKRVTR